MIRRGEVYDVDLGQPVGRGPASLRPSVIVSADLLSNGPGGLVAVVPVTTSAYGLRSHVELDTGGTGLGHVSFARCDQVRVISTRRLGRRRGTVAHDEARSIDRALRFVLDL